jgi:serine/threonine-protein kinase
VGFARVVWTIARRLFILTILIAAFIGSALLAIFLSRGKEVVVPKVVGKSQNEAKRIAQAAGLQVEIIEIVDDQSPADTVVRQDPKAGLLVKQGYTIKVYFSRGGKKSQVRTVKDLAPGLAQLMKAGWEEEDDGYKDCAFDFISRFCPSGRAG